MDENMSVFELMDAGHFSKALEKIQKTKDPYIKCSCMITYYARKNDFKGAFEFAEKNASYLSNYTKGFVCYKKAEISDYKNKKNEYKKAMDFLEKSLKDNPDWGLKNFNANMLLMDCYLQKESLESKKNEAPDFKKVYEILKKLEREYNPSNEGNVDLYFSKKPQYYLIKYFVDKALTGKENIDDLVLFFNMLRERKYNAFDCLVRYSFALKITPFDVIPAFLKSDMIWEDGYFEYLTAGYSDKEIDSFKRIWFWQCLILTQIYLSNSSGIAEISHYTSKTAFDQMNEPNNSPMRMWSLSAANDKIEGNVLPLILKKNGLRADVDITNENTYIPAQTSFSRSKESLTMFRLYGKRKEDKEEATGVSLVFDKNYFLTDFSFMTGNELEPKSEQNKENQENNHPEKNERGGNGEKDYRQPLAWVLYYNDEKNLLYFYPNEDELEPTRIDLNRKGQKWNSHKTVISKQKESRLEYSFKKLLSEVKSLRNTKHQEVAVKILYRLRYFIKVSDFAEEKELRLLDLVSVTSNEVKDGESSLYKEYFNVWAYDSLKEVVFAPKAIGRAELECYKKRIWGKHSRIEITISDAPLA